MSLDDQANLINDTFLQQQQAYQPLDESVKIHRQLDKHIQLFQLRLSPEQSGKVEYERERLLGFANK
jgi:hypothetical protein